MVLSVLSFRSAVADWNDVPTGSMKPTILIGDRIFVNKLAYDLKVPFLGDRLVTWGDPARGDIVICWSPADGARLVKRVEGVVISSDYENHYQPRWWRFFTRMI